MSERLRAQVGWDARTADAGGVMKVTKNTTHNRMRMI